MGIIAGIQTQLANHARNSAPGLCPCPFSKKAQYAWDERISKPRDSGITQRIQPIVLRGCRDATTAPITANITRTKASNAATGTPPPGTWGALEESTEAGSAIARTT